jgi:hypothetical protein
MLLRRHAAAAAAADDAGGHYRISQMTSQGWVCGQTSQFPTCSERERVIKSYDDYIDVTVLGATPHTLQLHVWRYPPHNGGPRARVSGWANSYRRRAAFGECLGFGSPPAPPAYGQCPAFGVRLRLMESRPYNWRRGREVVVPVHNMNTTRVAVEVSVLDSVELPPPLPSRSHQSRRRRRRHPRHEVHIYFVPVHACV